MEKSKPYFFKIVAGNYLNQRVKIPTLFVKELYQDMPDETTMTATIKGVAGQWPILLRKRTTGTYLENGWEKFMEDNSLGDHELLLFRNDGDMCFNLQIFEKNGCERIKAPAIFEEGLIKESDYSQGSSKIPPRGQALPLPSQNPYFTVHMKEYHVKRNYIVRFPSSFCTKHFPLSERKTVTLQNSEGEGWEATAFVNQKAYCLCTGWKNFVEANKIKLGDPYIFELLSTEEIRVKA